MDLSWISELSLTYDNLMNSSDLGDIPPLPISHSLQNAHVEIRLEPNGKFNTAVPLSKSDAPTIVPATEDSAARSSGIAPHALYDNLQYTAKTFSTYDGNAKFEGYYEAYLNQLKQWAEWESAREEVKAILKYIEGGTIISDLVKERILSLEPDGSLSKNWGGEKDNKPLEIAKTFIRFVVYDSIDNNKITPCNENYALQENYIKFYAEKKTEKHLCYVTGETAPRTEKHPSKIRGGGDSARLISSNDTSGFTFRGRFKDSSDAVSVSYEVSQKAHNALRWLVQTYGWYVGDETIVAWSMQGNEFPSLRGDSYDLVKESRRDFDDDDEKDEKSFASEVIEEVNVEAVKNAVNGYRAKQFNRGDSLDNIIVMGLEAATPGRLSVTMYHKLTGSEFLNNVENWHTGCAWNHDYKALYTEKDGKTQIKHVKFTGAPSPEDIVKAAYGDNVSDKVKKGAIKRIVEFIATGNRGIFPVDLMRLTAARVSNPAALDFWELRRITSIACAMIKMYRKILKGEEYSMELNVSDKLQHERNFMFGRVLAYMEEIENDAIYQQMGSEGDKRVPNAVKLRSVFVQRPGDTINVLNSKLTPYIQRDYRSWGGKKFQELQDLLTDMTESGFLDNDRNKPLDERHILGYSCQMSEFRKRKVKKEINADVDAENEN